MRGGVHHRMGWAVARAAGRTSVENAWPHEALRRRRTIMAEGDGGMSRTRIKLHMVGTMLGLVAWGAAGCDSQGSCSCPAPTNEAVVHMECLPIEPPLLKMTGPCSVCPVVLADGSIPEGAQCAVSHFSQDITLAVTDAGTCRVELIFPSGATSSVDLDFMSHWTACGADPHGCGEGFVAAHANSGPITLSVPESLCGAALDAEASD